MKKGLLIVTMVALMMTACSEKEALTSNETPIYDLSNVEVSDVGYISITDFYAKMVQKATESNSDQKQILLDYAQTQLDRAREMEQFLNDSLNNVHGTNGEAYGENWDHPNGGGKNRLMWFQYCTLRYKAKGALGRDEELSELVVWPYGNAWNPQPDNVIVGCHCTVLSNPERPTNFDDFDVQTDLFMFASFAHSLSQEALIVIPDYEGYGSTHGNTHPYIDREILAQQVVEGTKAAIAWYNNKFEEGIKEGWKSVALGYSQGGNVAASVLRYVQEHGETSLHMVGAVCGGGCYSPLETLKSYINSGRIYMPIATALMLKSCVDTQSDLAGLRIEDLCTEEFIETGIFDWIQEKKLITEDIQFNLLAHSAVKGGFLMYCYDKTLEEFVPFDSIEYRRKHDWNLDYGTAGSYCTPDAVFLPDVIDFFTRGTITNEGLPERKAYLQKLKALNHVLERNSLCYGWTPWAGAGFTFFHSTRDEVVPYCNVEFVDSKKRWDIGHPLPYRLIDYENASTYLHVATGTAFFIDYCAQYVDDLLNGDWQGGRKDEYGGKYY